MIVKWVEEESKFSNDLRDLHLILFDTHLKKMTKNFIDRKIPSIVLLESTQQNATIQKACFFIYKNMKK